MGGFKRKKRKKKSFFYRKTPLGFGLYAILYKGKTIIHKGTSFNDFIGLKLISSYCEMVDQAILNGY